MPTRHAQPRPSDFHLNLEQQKKRAKDLLRDAQAGDPGALARLKAHPPRPSAARPAAPSSRSWTLTDAQRTIARELRFASWARLKAHAAAMQRELHAITTGAPAPDAQASTLHVRCGSDIQQGLRHAGFTGDFLEHALPYYSGPVSAGAERHERMARFLVEAFPQAKGGLVFERVLAELEEGERALADSTRYERVVLWMEHDPWDQLILARLLAAYAGPLRPKVLELIQVNEFPGAARFIGLGQLPAEALRALWATRRPVNRAQLSLGQEVWQGLCADHPQALAALARSGTPALPLMAHALRRHLQELPWTHDGLSLTQRLLLQTTAQRSASLHELFRELGERDPLPSITDTGLLHLVTQLQRATEPPLLSTAQTDGGNVFAQQLRVTAAGSAVLAGERDFASLGPQPWWVGGVRATPQPGAWRWHEPQQKVVWHG